MASAGTPGLPATGGLNVSFDVPPRPARRPAVPLRQFPNDFKDEIRHMANGIDSSCHPNRV
jgi:hypothetical protein